MVGFISDREARIWVRLNGPHDVRVQSTPADEGTSLARATVSRAIRADPSRDNTAVIPLTDLTPDTAYRYAVIVEEGDAEQVGPFAFRTLPPKGRPGIFRVAFGSCASVDYDPVQPIWRAIAQTRPQAFLWLGDNIYGDSEDPEVLRKKYRRQRSVSALMDFQATVAQLAIWDDHDFGLNNGDRTFPAREKSLQVFREYWANPQASLSGHLGRASPGDGAEIPGVFFRWSVGDVDFFLLDGRTHRDPNRLPDGPEKTQLGATQKQWLKSELKKSRAVFKVLVAPGAWTEGKGPGGDSWAAFLHERNEIFDFLLEEGITGVFLLAGDTHRPQINLIPRTQSGRYDLYEVISSPLAQEVDLRPIGPGNFRPVRPANAFAVNFGLLEFDTQARPPRVKVRLIDADGKDLWAPLVLTADRMRLPSRSPKK
jgi:alkaline phosphatase D